MEVSKIYLETTLFNYYFDSDRDAHADTVTLFEDCKAGLFEAYTSSYVIDELQRAPEPKRTKMLELIGRYNITLLNPSSEAVALARKYVAEKALPAESLADATHIAVASINYLDIIVSLNFSHIVRPRTVERTGHINALMGYKPILIETPMGVISSEKVRYNR
ncbi:hypothetical protein FACS18948_3840 [Clostridia bacterium]|nr:hypothetical protein FACS18948_3840 [Clostridia bacterium]